MRSLSHMQEYKRTQERDETVRESYIEPCQGSESERIATQGGALRAYPGLCHRTPLGFRRARHC